MSGTTRMQKEHRLEPKRLQQEILSKEDSTRNVQLRVDLKLDFLYELRKLLKEFYVVFTYSA